MLDGLNAADLATELGMDRSVVEAAFHQIAVEDGHLHVTRGDRASILYHTSTAVKETPPMSVMNFLKWILGKEAAPEEKIKDLEKKRAEIDDSRRSLERDLNDLVKKQEELVKLGVAAASDAARRRLASQHAQVGRELSLQNEKVLILDKQSQILARQIHNLEVAHTAKTSELPASEEITEAAAAAEGALEELDERYEAVQTVSSAASDQLLTDDVVASLALFEAEAAKQAEKGKAVSHDAPETEPAESAELPEPDRTSDQRQREADA
jgi:hypothetical protein